MSPFTLRFSGITPQKWDAVRAAFAKHGIDVAADAKNGTIETHGASADFARIGESGEVLVITVTKKPFFISVDRITEGLTEIVEGA